MDRHLEPKEQLEIARNTAVRTRLLFRGAGRFSINVLVNEADQLARSGERQEAIVVLQNELIESRKRGREHTQTLWIEHRLGELLSADERYEEARLNFAEILELTSSLSHKSDLYLRWKLWAQASLGELEGKTGKFEESRAFLQAATMGYQEHFGRTIR